MLRDYLKTLTKGAAVVAAAFLFVGVAHAAPLLVPGGGTGGSAFTGALIGNGTAPFTAVAPGTSGNVLTSNGSTWVSSAAPGSFTLTTSGTSGAATFVGGTLNIPQYQAAGNYATFSYPFPSNATSTLIAFNGGLTASNATTTNLFSGRITGNTLSVGGTASTTIDTAGLLTAQNIINSGVSANQVIYTNNSKQEVSVATSSASCSAGISCGSTSYVIGSALSITGVNAVADGSTKGVSTYTAADFNDASGVISIDYTNGQAANGTTKGFLTAADWLTFNGKLGTSTTLTQGNLLYSSGSNTVASVATGTVSAGSSAITVTAGRSVIGGSLSIDCAAASASQNGCLSSANWTTFNNKIDWGAATSTSANQVVYTNNAGKLVSIASSTPTISSGLTYSGTMGAVVGGTSGNLTCNTANGTTFGCLAAADWLTFNNKIGTSSALTNGQLLVAGPNGNTAYSIATSSASCSSGVSCSAFTVVGSVSPSITNTGVTSAIGTANQIAVSAATGAVTFSIPADFRVGSSTLTGSTLLTNATTTALAVKELTAASCDVKATTSGSLYCGTDASGGGGAYPFAGTGNSTSTLTQFNGGLTSYASTTIGGGATTTGLTINGAATTTGTAYFAGQIGVGTSSPFTGALVVDSAGLTTNTYLTGSVNNFLELNIQNRNSGGSASTDVVATANNGSPTAHYINMGINGSGGAGAPFTTANHAYLFSIDDTLNIGALGASAVINFYTTGGTSPVLRGLFDSSGRFGVGTSTPGTLLSVNGDAVIAGLVTGQRFVATSTSVASIFPYASTTAISATATSTFSAAIGIGSSTPSTALSLAASSTIVAAETVLGTTTSMTIDWRQGNQQNIKLGTSATTIAFSNYIAGGTLRLIICNPNGTAGALTWPNSSVLRWPAGTTPTQTTTANKCDVWSFVATTASSTAGTTIILGAQSANYP